MYKLNKNLQGEINGVSFMQGNMLFVTPFDPANTDYANFKREILSGEAELQNADGETMPPEDAKDFVRTLP